MKTFKELREASKITNQKKKSAIRDLSHGGSNDPHTGHAGMSRHHASMADEHKGTEAGKHHQRASDHHERALAALKKGNLKSGLAHAKNASDAASAAFNSNKHSSSHGGMKDSQALHKHHEREVGFNVNNKSRDAENLKRDKPKRSDKPIQRAIGKTKSAFKKLIGNKKQTSEGFVSAAQRKAVWASKADGGKGHPDNKKKSKKEDAVADFLAKGGKIKKLPPAKAQGYHGKDDPGSDVHGMINKDDSKAIGTRKKVKSMEGTIDEASPKQVKMAIGVASDKRYAGGNMTGAVKAIDKIKPGLSNHPQVAAVLKRQNEAKQTHMFDNEKDARAKAKEIGGKYVRGTGKSTGKHAAIREKQVNELSPATKKSYINKAASDIDNRSYAQGTVDATNTNYNGKNNRKIANRLKGIRRATKN